MNATTYVQSLRRPVTGPFASRHVPMTDGGHLFEVVDSEGERIGAASNPLACDELRDRLNTTVAEWLAESNDHTGG
jgi:hypothetical protein